VNFLEAGDLRMKNIVVTGDGFEAGRSAAWHELFAESFPRVLVTRGVGAFESMQPNVNARLPFRHLPRHRCRAAD